MPKPPKLTDTAPRTRTPTARARRDPNAPTRASEPTLPPEMAGKRIRARPAKRSKRPARVLESQDERSTAERQRDFLAGFAKWGNVTTGCKAAGISRRTFYDWTNPKDTAFSAEFTRQVEEAREAVIDGLEEVLMMRAADKSDLMMIFALKNNRERYADKQKVELTGAEGGPIGYVDLKGEVLRKLEALATREAPGSAGSVGSVGSAGSVEVRQLRRA